MVTVERVIAGLRVVWSQHVERGEESVPATYRELHTVLAADGFGVVPDEGEVMAIVCELRSRGSVVAASDLDPIVQAFARAVACGDLGRADELVGLALDVRESGRR